MPHAAHCASHDAAAEQLDLAAQYISSRPRSGNADHIHSVLDEAHSRFKGRCIQTGSRPGGCDCLTAEDVRAGLEALKDKILLQEGLTRMQPAHACTALSLPTRYAYGFKEERKGKTPLE